MLNWIKMHKIMSGIILLFALPFVFVALLMLIAIPITILSPPTTHVKHAEASSVAMDVTSVPTPVPTAISATSTPAPTPTPGIEYVSVTAAEMWDAFEKNELSANKKFKGKDVKVTGTVDSIGEILGQQYVTLQGDEYFGSVQCMANTDKDVEFLSNVSKGDTITASGVCDGKSFNVSIRKCSFNN